VEVEAHHAADRPVPREIDRDAVAERIREVVERGLGQQDRPGPEGRRGEERPDDLPALGDEAPAPRRRLQVAVVVEAGIVRVVDPDDGQSRSQTLFTCV
jgi:hypothetical protein